MPLYQGINMDASSDAWEPIYTALWDADATKAQTLTLDTKYHRLLEVYVRSTVAINVHLDASPDGTNWVEDVNSWTDTTAVNEGFLNASRYIRVRTDATTTAGTVSIVITAK